VSLIEELHGHLRKWQRLRDTAELWSREHLHAEEKCVQLEEALQVATLKAIDEEKER